MALREDQDGEVPDRDEHVVAHTKPFGLHRVRAVCSCGYESKPVEGTEWEAAEAARQLLVTDHGARDLGPDAPAFGVLLGEPGRVRPGLNHPWTPPNERPRQDRPRRLP